MDESIAASLASLTGRPPEAALTAVAHCGFIAMIQALPYLLAILAVVPLVGFMVTGSWRLARRYCRAWARSITILLVVGAIMIWLIGPMITTT